MSPRRRSGSSAKTSCRRCAADRPSRRSRKPTTSTRTAVIDALVTGANTKIDKIAQRRHLDAARVTALKQQAEQRITKLVNEGAPAKGKVRKAIAAEAIGLAAKTIGIERKDLVQAVRGGQTVAEVAQAHDVDPQAVIDALVTGANTKIDKIAERRHLDAARVTALKEQAEQRITKLVNEGAPAKGNSTPTS